MALEPQDDNRDGVAIRVASERLMRRNQHQRFLIVFSDGRNACILIIVKMVLLIRMKL